MKKIAAVLSSALFCLNSAEAAATVNVSGSASTVQSIIGASNQFLGRFTMDISGEQMSFGAMYFHLSTTNLITDMSIVDIESGRLEILGGNAVNDAHEQDSEGFSHVWDVLPPSYPVGVHTYEVRGTLSRSFTNGETFSILVNPASDWVSGQGDTTGDPVSATPSSELSFGIVIAKAPIPQTIELLSVSSSINRFAINGKFGHTYYVQESSNLVDWNTIGQMLIAPGDRFEFTLPASTNSQAFYRFKEL